MSLPNVRLPLGSWINQENKGAVKKIGILGTGSVAKALAGGCVEVGHTVTLGSRHPKSRTDLSDPVDALEAMARDAVVVVNATPGVSSLELLVQLDPGVFSGMLLIDVSNAATSAFDLLCPDSSRGEKILEMLPDAHAVKTMDTCTGKVFVNPSSLDPSNIFVSGNDVGAKRQTMGLPRDLGWSDEFIVDVGVIETAKGPAHYLIMWAYLADALGTTAVNMRVVR